MYNESTTPPTSPPSKAEDSSGPGLFSVTQESRAKMEKPTDHDEANSRSTSENSNSDQVQSKKSSNIPTSSKRGRSHDSNSTTTPSDVKPHQEGQQQSTTPAMAPPPKPIFKATPTSAQPPQQPLEPEADQELPATPAESKRDTNRQPTTSSKHANKDATNTVTRKRSHGEVDQRQIPEEHDNDDNNEDEASNEFNEPANPITHFDWDDLYTRYHQKVQECTEQEHELYRQFEGLCQYFYIWAQSGQQHEVDRSFKRIRTQVTLVQHHEEELESKRQHYIKVVEAFKSALQLLTGD